MTNPINFDNQIFLISINAPAPLSVYLWTRFFEELKHKNVIGLDNDAEHIDYVAKQDFSIYFDEYTSIFGIQQVVTFNKGNVVPAVKKLIPEPFYSIIENRFGVIT